MLAGVLGGAYLSRERSKRGRVLEGSWGGRGGGAESFCVFPNMRVYLTSVPDVPSPISVPMFRIFSQLGLGLDLCVLSPQVSAPLPFQSPAPHPSPILHPGTAPLSPTSIETWDSPGLVCRVPSQEPWFFLGGGGRSS